MFSHILSSYLWDSLIISCQICVGHLPSHYFTLPKRQLLLWIRVSLSSCKHIACLFPPYEGLSTPYNFTTYFTSVQCVPDIDLFWDHSDTYSIFKISQILSARIRDRIGSNVGKMQTEHRNVIEAYNMLISEYIVIRTVGAITRSDLVEKQNNNLVLNDGQQAVKIWNLRY